MASDKFVISIQASIRTKLNKFNSVASVLGASFTGRLDVIHDLPKVAATVVPKVVLVPLNLV